MVREIRYEELTALLELYLHLHEDSVPKMNEHLQKTWNSIMNDPSHHILVNEVDGKLVSSCVCVIIPNLTRNVRPYAFIENVVTHEDYRGMGLAGECLEAAGEIARREKCYKMMLLTGSKEESTLNFYRNAGYNSGEKTAFCQETVAWRQMGIFLFCGITESIGRFANETEKYSDCGKGQRALQKVLP